MNQVFFHFPKALTKETRQKILETLGVSLNKTDRQFKMVESGSNEPGVMVIFDEVAGLNPITVTNLMTMVKNTVIHIAGDELAFLRNKCTVYFKGTSVL